MFVIAHQHPCMHAPVIFTGLAQRVQKESPVIIMKNGLATPPCHNVTIGPGRLSAKLRAIRCLSANSKHLLSSYTQVEER